METVAVKSYDAKIDSKKRITLRNALYEYFHIEEYADGKIVLEPRVLVKPFEVSKNTLAMMDSSVENFKNGIVSGDSRSRIGIQLKQSDSGIAGGITAYNVRAVIGGTVIGYDHFPIGISLRLHRLNCLCNVAARIVCRGYNGNQAVSHLLVRFAKRP